MSKHTLVRHTAQVIEVTLMKSDRLIEPRNPSKNSATRFYFKVAPSSISKTMIHFRLQIMPSLQIILYFHVVLKKNIPSIFAFCGAFESKAAMEQFKPHLFMSICVTGMNTVVTSIPGWRQKFQTESPPSTGSVKIKSALLICINLTCLPCQISQIR